MAYSLKTDQEILQDLAEKLDLLRRMKQIKDTELVQKGGTNRDALNNFRSGRGGISLTTFIRLLRGLDELDRLEACFQVQQPFSPTGKHRKIPEKRVRDKQCRENTFTWGEDK